MIQSNLPPGILLSQTKISPLFHTNSHEINANFSEARRVLGRLKCASYYSITAFSG